MINANRMKRRTSDQDSRFSRRHAKIQTENQKVNSWSIADARGMPVHVTAPHRDPEFKARH
jgi:hypothetical protein